jgi:large subunit ribosomal protein L22
MTLTRPKREKLNELKEERKNLSATGGRLRCPASKARIRARTIIGLPVTKAVALLANSPNSSANLMLRVLNSAISNATRNKTSMVNGRPGSAYDLDQLLVDKVIVNMGTTYKRHRPIAHGKSVPILKRTCHITVHLKAIDLAPKR